ncbi:type I pullulanase [Alicyclobacillus curvatus]|nr:type I pullulanase [Alicyclobacillus curvatus]
MKSRWQRLWARSFLTVLFVVVALLFNLSSAIDTAKASSAGTQVIVHYYRFAGDYTGWNLWMWPKSGNGSEYDFTGTDSYGEVTDATIPGSPSQVGVIVRLGNWQQKDVSENRYISITNGKAEVWLVQGNPTVFYSQSQALAAAKPAASNAFLDSPNQLLVKLNTPARISRGQFSIVDKTTGATVPVTAVSNANYTQVDAALVGDFQQLLGAKSNWDPSSDKTKLTQTGPDLYQFTATLPAGSYQYKVALNGTWDVSYPSQNVDLTVPSGGRTVTFSYIPSTNQVFDSVNTPAIQAVVASDFQTALGATSNWSTSDPATAMKQVNPDLYQFTANIPAGSYQYKIAIGNSWSTAYPSTNVSLTIPSGGEAVTFSYVPSTHQVFDTVNQPNAVLTDGKTTDLATVTLGTTPNVTHDLTLSWKSSQPVTVIPRNVLDLPQYTYTGTDLGNTYSSRDTKFRVWAPTASSMNLLLYNSADGSLTKTIPMQASRNGTWYADVPGNLQNWYYLYQVTIDGNTQTAVDPYATDIAPNGTRGMIISLAATNPPGWGRDTHVSPKTPEDTAIYEVHVRDFSIDANSGMKHKGEYLAFTEQGTKGPSHVATGIDSLKQLGITDVQVQPVQEFASINELGPKTQYNWGYDPRNYDVPEGYYATTPYGTARITQYKQMVQSLHKAGIGVIMDVVYNHTFATKVSDFDKLVPEYYYRTDSAGNYTNGSGVGNELATERPMVRKFVLDSTKFWVQQYHVDGFRFDLMALLGTNTMKAVSEELHRIDKGILLYGEPWTGGTSGITGDTLLTKGQQQGLGVGVFNDNIRNALDGNVFNSSAQGFATGATGEVPAIENGIVGSIPYNSAIHDFAASPSETINYVTSHDNMTLWDKIAASNPNDSVTNRTYMDELAQAVVFTSQGIPFMQGGEEMLRTKGGNANSYNAGDAVNEFDWSRKAQYPDVFNYYAGLIHLRLDHPAFRMTTAAQIRQHLQFLSSPGNTIEYELTDNANGDHWKNIVVIFNPNQNAEPFSLPAGKWTIAATRGKVGEHTLGHAQGTVTVPGIACEILYQTENAGASPAKP